MKIVDGTKTTVVDHVLSGFYKQNIKGIKGKYYEFSSPLNPISSFQQPFDAYLTDLTFTGKKINAVGNRLVKNCEPTTERSGSLYFLENVDLVGTCHGFGRSESTYYSGYNFYNAFYPMGYFSPPFGEQISIFKSNQDGYANLENGSCNNLTATEYNELFGIVSKSASDTSILTTTLAPSVYSPIYSPRETCPPEVASTSYYDEFQFTHIAGTSKDFGAGNFFNSNPIPTSLDSFDIKVNGRYETEVISKDRYIVYEGGRPVSSYTVDSQTNKLNNNLCFATLMETKVSSNRGTNGAQLMDTADATQGGIGEQVSFAGAEHFHYWHFTFKENAETLPFLNNFVATEGSKTHPRKLNEGTQLFLPTLSNDEYYWQNRQCPDTVDFLPHTVGASIYSCPSEHFDVPYYAALKKFGFYGTRFLNTCKALNLENTLSGVENASELPQSEDGYGPLDTDTLEPDGLDKDGNWTFSLFDNLLKIAKREEQYANMYALNKAFFFWANSGYILQDPNYLGLVSENPAVSTLFESLILKFKKIFDSGVISFTGNEPNILERTDSTLYTLIESGRTSDLLLNDREYLGFRESLQNVISGNQLESWMQVENKYGYYVSNGNSLNEDFYNTIISGKEKRIRTRYLENIVRGNPVDLFPLNNITFSTDNAKDYIENTSWGRSSSSFGVSSDLPEVNRRYFEGAYGKPSSITGLLEIINNLNLQDSTSFYPGFFNDYRLNKTLPGGTYQRAISGKILDSQKRSFSASGWLGLGYNEIGKLESNFSCFTPIFIQQPLPTIFCKIGQHPTLRVNALDYHTIPEDKISRRYPEITYWASKLKLLDCNGKYMYPLKYKWYRIEKEKFDASLSDGTIFGESEIASQTGEWGCIEGDGPDCTVFHPLDSYPIFEQKQPKESYTFIKGVNQNIDDNYYYYCAVSGRFGIRISEMSELNIEDWVRFDMSIKNGLNSIGNAEITFEINDYLGETYEITFSNSNILPNYGGYEQDLNAIPESVIEQKIPPPNAGFGDVRGFRFIGPNAYIGATRTYTPSRLTDTRGLRETWGHLLEYGQLTSFEKELTQEEGDLLYGYKHLPTCESYEMGDGKKGIKVIPKYNGFKVGHWSLGQRAVISTDMKAGIQWNRLINFGELYPPSNSRIDNAFPNFGIGHWQWGNNLGAIKRFGKFSTSKDAMLVGGYFSSQDATKNTLLEKVKDKLIGPSDLAGENCGYTKYGLGRNTLYYLEAYERFYVICDPLKKKNVPNKTFLAPGIRLNNSAIQYFWLGQPSNTYVKRRPMYGPYAFQWRVSRHNRDRNGNGISEGFYSMGYSTKYSLLYDAPAIYGLYVKTTTNSRYKTLVSELKDARNTLKDSLDLNSSTIRNVWFGERGNEGTSRNYGDITFSCNPNSRSYSKEVCDYVSKAQSLAGSPNFSDHKCPEDLLSVGACFDPCLSLRYAQGFYPGGKSLDLFGYGGDTSKNDINDKNVKIVPLASVKYNELQQGDEVSTVDSNLKFRSPINTPHARITRGIKTVADSQKDKKFVAGISTCQDGGSDHCNYITPTIHLGPSNFLIGKTSIFGWMKNYAAEVYHADYNIRGEIT